MATHENLIPVVMGGSGVALRPFQRERLIALPLNDVVANLKASIEQAGLWVLHEIDPQAILRKGGYAISGTRQILFFHPALMSRLLSADIAAVLEVPLKYALIEEAGQVRMRWFDPAPAFARYGNDALAVLGRELSQTCERIADGLAVKAAAIA